MYRGLFHLTPPAGWLNDPNGFSWFGGKYHLFYQHYPHDTAWGPMHWGHAVSVDLIRWTHLPIALAPDQEYDTEGCFSGSAVTDGDQHALIYTGHVDPDPKNPARKFETQCLARGDGTTYKKEENNPVIGSDLLPQGASLADFRDPKVWKEAATWYCLVASRHSDGHGQTLLFAGTDLTRWKLVGPALQSHGRLGGMWECPDFFVLDDRDVMLWSVMGEPKKEGCFQNPFSVVWAPGNLDRTTGVFTPREIMEIDHGPDFYAPQTMRTPDGRIVMVAWMQMWERSMPTHDLGEGWAGSMTIPRELFWIGDCLAQRPVRELEAFRRDGVEHRFTLDGSRSLSGVQGQHLDLEVEFRNRTASQLGIRLFKGETEETALTWEPDSRWLILDRSRAGASIVSKSASHPECLVHQARVSAPEGIFKLRILLDRSSIEVFAQDGLATMTATVFPGESGTGVEFFTVGGTTEVVCHAWKLAVAN